MRLVLCGALVTLLAAPPAHAARTQSADDPRLDRESARAVQALTDSARSERLPTRALTGVLQEGLSQHANGTRIVRAMQDYLHALRAAGTALGAGSTETELVSGAGALLAGVSPAALAQIRAARGKDPVVVPLVVLGDLVARGVPASAAGVAIADATKRGLPDQQLNALRERVEHDIASGVGAAAALESVARGFNVPAAAPADSIARRRKPPREPDRFARIELDQLGGGSGTPAHELRADVSTPMGGRSPFVFSANAMAVDAALLSGPGALANASLLVAAGTHGSGIAAGPGARLISTTGTSWLSPTMQAGAWHRAGPWTFSLDAAFGSVPVRSASTVAQNGGLSWTRAAARGLRLDVVPSDTPIYHGPSTPPPAPVTVDSGGQRLANMISATATEARFAVARRLGRFEFEGAAGIRSYAARRSDAWSSATVAVALFDRVGFVAGGAMGPENVLSPVNGPRYFAGLRLTTGPSIASSSPASTESAAVVFRMIPGAVTTTLEIRAPMARSVEVVGDFTDWVPLALSTAGGGAWSVTRAIEPGLHRVRMRINGGEWSAPPGLPQAADMFGGAAGVLTIGGQ